MVHDKAFIQSLHLLLSPTIHHRTFGVFVFLLHPTEFRASPRDLHPTIILVGLWAVGYFARN